MDNSEIDEFFTQNSVNISTWEEQVNNFVVHHLQTQKKIVLVTSGGTTVPLEKNTVRFLDNFSGGKRGSTSAEEFLDKGYAVIFLHRMFSLQPFSRRFALNTKTRNFLDFLIEGETKQVQVIEKYQESVNEALLLHNNTKTNKTLLKIPFVTVQDYLFLLRMIATKLQVFERRAIIYAAAAVSDFYIHPDQLYEHKIQSSGYKEGLTLNLSPVPKMLKALQENWSPNAYIISFKLETKEELLEPKSLTSLRAYNHQMVIGNLLSSHSEHVIFYMKNGDKKEVFRTPEEKEHEIEIESKMIPFIIEQHENFCNLLN